MQQKRGLFIVFEGIDGCGKGTQLLLSANYLFNLNKNIDLYLTREPTRDFKEIRERMKRGVNVKDDKEWYAEQFIADRVNHSKEYIYPSIRKGTHVLSDRYKHSTLSYQHTQGMDFNRLVQMHKEHPEILVPDLTLIYDCPAEIAFERRRKEGLTEVFDKDLDFQEKLRENYLKLQTRLHDENIIILDSKPPIDEVAEETKRCLSDLIKT